MLKFVFACLIGSFAVASVLADEIIVNEDEDLGGRQLGLPSLPSLPSQLPGIRPPALPSLNNPILQDISGAWLPTFVRSGLSCYSCEGKDAGSCIDFFSADDSITCQSNEYCAVTRTEQKGTLRIWRGCLSLSGVRSSLQGNTRHNEINEEGNKKYTQFCQTNLCNTGNGLLKCYSCEGTGSDSACMKKNPSKTDVTCGPNQYCSVVRTTLTPVVDNSATVASVAAPVAATDAKQTKNSEATYSITRKCENHYHNRWSNSIEYPYSVNLTPGRYEVAYACSTDFCNAVDGQEISPFQNANDVSRSPWSNPTFIGYATFLSDPRSTSISRNGSRIYFKDIRKRVKA